MARDNGSVEFLDPVCGAEDEPGVRPRLRPVPIVGAAAGAAVLIGAILASGGHGHPAPRASSVPRPSPTAAVAATVQTRAVVVRHLGVPLLGARTGEELFARGPGFVLRIQLARGIVTRTLVPSLRTPDAVSFLPLRSAVLLRPTDPVPGYAVADGAAARRPSGALELSGPAWPAADPSQLWVDVSGRIVLVGQRGRVLRSTIPVPLGASPLGGWPDGRGYLMFETIYGWYDARPDGTVQVTRGNLLAVGPTRYVVSECGSSSCDEQLVDRATGRHTALGPPPPVVGIPGVVNAAGSTAARVDPRSGVLVLTDLTTGQDRTVGVHPAADPQSMAWSPDSRWLFVADQSARLRAVDALSPQVVDLSPLAGGPVAQVAVRPAVGR